MIGLGAFQARLELICISRWNGIPIEVALTIFREPFEGHAIHKRLRHPRVGPILMSLELIELNDLPVCVFKKRAMKQMGC